MEWIGVISIFGAIVSSAVTTTILATHYFKIVDDHVKEICNMTEKFVDECVMDLRKHVQNFSQEE